jgi:hypothetical protein
MKTTRNNMIIGVAVSAILFAFTSRPGAHSVQIYLDSRLVIDHYVDSKKQVPEVRADNSENYNQLIVKYSECGRTVTGRKLTVKDEANKILKDWHFEGASAGFKDPMAIAKKDLAGLKQKGNNVLTLYYSSNEFPEGQPIATLVIGSGATTAHK